MKQLEKNKAKMQGELKAIENDIKSAEMTRDKLILEIQINKENLEKAKNDLKKVEDEKENRLEDLDIHQDSMAVANVQKNQALENIS